MKSSKNINRVFDGNQFGKQKSVDRSEMGMAPRPPPKKAVNRAFSSKSDVTSSHSPSFKQRQLKQEEEQKEKNSKQTTKPTMLLKRSNSSAVVGTSKLKKKRPNLRDRASYDKPLPARNLKDRNNKKRDSLKVNPKRKVSGGILNRLQSLQAKVDQNHNNKNGAFAGNYSANQELADSPTDEVAGPNPLQNLPSQNQYQ